MANFIVSLLLSRFLSRILVRNIEKAAGKVKEIGEYGDVKERINHKGKDEVAFLTGEFDRLLDKFEESQEKIIESEKVEAKVQMAKEIAHNIKSPIIAIEMMLPMMIKLPERMRNVLYNSVKEIKTLSERLKTQADLLSVNGSGAVDAQTLYLPIVLQDIICQKQLEYSSQNVIQIQFKDETGSNEAFIRGCSIELKSILSNLINNAVESYGAHGGKVDIKLSCDLNSCTISVSDSGAGIPAAYVNELGSKRITFKGSGSRGVGLMHAFKVANLWGGRIEVKSSVGIGTTVLLILPLFAENTKGVVKTVSSVRSELPDLSRHRE